MVLYTTQVPWPTSADLPDSDDTPVDNELQNLIPNLLLTLLNHLWDDRSDWFFGVDMGIYYRPDPRPIPIIPDGFLSIGVERRKNPPRGRLSYVLWEEKNVVPRLVLECVSQTYGGEYDSKAEKYALLGVQYYVIYNPDHSHRDGHDPLEVYELHGGYYQRLEGEPVWLTDLGLGIGRAIAPHDGWEREWLFWYTEEGRTLTPTERIQVAQQRSQLESQRANQEAQRADQEAQRADQEARRAEILAQKLRSLGLNPDDVD